MKLSTKIFWGFLFVVVFAMVALCVNALAL